MKESKTEESSGIKLCADGKYRWYYEYPMLKHPVILFTIWKIMLVASLAPGLVIFFSELANGFISAIKSFLMIYFLTFCIIFLLSNVGYLIASFLYGFKYIVLFEMDEEGISHTQKSRQFKKAQAIAWLAAFAGTITGLPSVIGANISSSSKYRMVSDFKNVSEIVGKRKNNTIKVNQLFVKNQVYVNENDYDFVWDFITSHCEKAKIKK